MAYDDGIGAIVIGVILCLTGVGAIIGIPLIIWGLMNPPGKTRR